MHTLSAIRTLKTRNFTVRVDAVEDQDLDLSWDETGETARKLETGDLCAFGVVVRVYFKGHEIGEDSLWGCIYELPRAFMDHLGIKRNHPGCGSYFTDMIRQAIKEARRTLSAMQSVHIRAGGGAA